jgi:outer membrane receptor for monomeric catechols
MEGLSMAFGATYTGETRLVSPLGRYLVYDIESTRIYEDPYWKFDARLAYDTTVLGLETTFSINVKNLLGEKALNAPGRPISPRQVYFRMKVDF